MSEPNSKEELAFIDFEEDLVERISQLHISGNYSDVVLIVEDQRIPAHKCILAVGNEYFQKLLYGSLKESNQIEIELKVPLEAFNVVLQFIYSGKICLLDIKDEVVVEILNLAHMYDIKQLESAIIKFLIKAMAINNVCVIFNVARLCQIEDLTKACYSFMDRNAIDILADESFMKLTKESLQDIFSRDTLLAPEFQIFTAISSWCTQNPDVDASSILSNVRLCLMNIDEILQIRKTGLINAETLMDAIEERNTLKTLPYRVWPDENMAAIKYKSQLIRRDWKTDTYMPDAYDLEGTKQGAIETDPVYKEIVVKLGITSAINFIDINLKGEDMYSSYFVEVSVDQSQWTMIANYTQYNCHKQQRVYFSPRYVKYIKLISTGKKDLTITTLKALYKEKIPKLINGFEVASFEITGLLQEEGEIVSIFSNRKSTNRTTIKISLMQPFYIQKLRLLLCENTKNSEYDIEMSPNDRDWWLASTSSLKTGNWMEVVGEPFPLVHIQVSSNYEEIENAEKNIVYIKTEN